MKKFINILFLVCILFSVVGAVNAKSFINPISSAIRKSEISHGALISVSFKDISNPKNVYEYNSKMPMIPASIQKIATLLPALNTLGNDYEFKTQLYKDGNNNLYLKLGADPYLTSKDLKSMLQTLAKYKIYSIKNFYIDDSILDSNEWGEGWQWDDDLNPLIPKFGSYNLDNNLLTIDVLPTTPGAPADISTEIFYPTAFMNNVVTADKTNIKLQRKNYISPDVINADGTVAVDTTIQIPVNYPRRYFVLRLEEILRKQKISYYGDFNRAKLPKNTYLIAEVKHPISDAQSDILKKSNNMVAETVFKTAGGKYVNNTGSAESAIEMFNDYYKQKNINTSNINIVDGSGVSKNNLITADFMTNVLLKNSKDKDFKIRQLLAVPGEGTLTDRMLYFKGNLSAKTGTLTNISTIAGYLTTKRGKTYAFCIMTNDPKSKSADKKSFEEYVLRAAYDKL